MPEVRFDDVMVVTANSRDGTYPIDPKFLEVCEPHSIEVCGTSVDLPIAVGAVVSEENVRVRLSGIQWEGPTRVVIRLTGIRRGFRNLRMPDRSREEFVANERFIQSAYPGETTP